jgi:hypothetical protein
MAEHFDPMTDPETRFHQRLEEVFHLDWVGRSRGRQSSPSHFRGLVE